MKFDLEKIIEGAPVVCRDGTSAKFISYHPEYKSKFRVIFCIDGDSKECYDELGNWGNNESGYDILMRDK